MPNVRLLVLFCLCWCVGYAHSAQAHPAASSAVYVDLTPQQIVMEIQMPTDQLAMALDRPLLHDADALADAEQQPLTAYLQQHIHITQKDGEQSQDLPIVVENLQLQKIDQVEHLTGIIRVHTTAEDVQGIQITDTAILHRVVTHKTFVLLRKDWQEGLIEGDAKPLDTIRYQRESVTITRSEQSWQKPFYALLMLGMVHIQEGSDHLLFLLLLLIPTALSVGRKSWRTVALPRVAIQRALLCVTAFTIGHSMTLAIGAAGWQGIPSHIVEIAIAVTIFISAIHNIRPLFAHKEAYIAVGFGCIHGLAFAETLRDMGVNGGAWLLSLAAFNIGIELMQVLLLVLLLPLLWTLLSLRSWRMLPAIAGIVGMILSVFWFLERAFAVTNPTNAAVQWVLDHPWMCWSALVMCAVFLKYRDLRDIRNFTDLKNTSSSQAQNALEKYAMPANSSTHQYQ